MSGKFFDREIVITALRTRYGDPLTAFLYGSNFSGTADESSDIDCIVVSPAADISYRETFLEKGLLFDVFVFNPRALFLAMEGSYKAGNPILVESVVHSELLRDDYGLGDRFLLEAKRLKGQSLLPTKQAADALRYSLTALIDDFKRGPFGLERSLLLSEIVNTIIDIHVLSIGEGKRTPVRGGRILKNSDSTLAAHINRAYLDAMEGVPSALLGEAVAALNLLGGPLRENYKDLFHLPVRG
jgi:predicted nucleotidyltransferase